MMIFYHVSNFLYHSAYFYPRIPRYRHPMGEDKKTPRISVGSNIDDCFSAIPGGGRALRRFRFKQRGYFLLYRINTEKLGIKEENIIYAEELEQEKKVFDVSLTKENWITVPFTVPPEDQFLIQVQDWKEEVVKLEIPAEKDHYNNDFLRICKLSFLQENIESHTSFPLFYETKKESQLLLSYLREHQDDFTFDPSHFPRWKDNIQLPKNDYSRSVMIKTKKTMNLHDLWLYHYRLSDHKVANEAGVIEKILKLS